MRAPRLSQFGTLNRQSTISIDRRTATEGGHALEHIGFHNDPAESARGFSIARNCRKRQGRGVHWAMSLAFMLVLWASWPASALPDTAASSSYTVSGDIAAYLGVVPAAIVRGHPAAHPEGQMHGGVPPGAHEYHLVVAIFEKATGKRNEDAKITATISGLGHVGGTRIALDQMPIAGVVT
jgi:hypothetical protein